MVPKKSITLTQHILNNYTVSGNYILSCNDQLFSSILGYCHDRGSKGGKYPEKLKKSEFSVNMNETDRLDD